MTKTFINAIKTCTYDDEVRDIASASMYNPIDRPFAEEILQNGMEPDEARSFLASKMPAEEAAKFRAECARLSTLVH